MSLTRAAQFICERKNARFAAAIDLVQIQPQAARELNATMCAFTQCSFFMVNVVITLT
jgi:hypothetical protein